jgi:urease accessory protein
MLTVSLFALFHGHAHGAEMPASASGLLYGAGFVAATATLHTMGIGLGRLFRGATATRYAPLAGLGIAGFGAALLIGS